MIIIFEGPDNVGKDTQIKLLIDHLVEQNIRNRNYDPIHVLKYSGFGKNLDTSKIRRYSRGIYRSMFINFDDVLRHQIFILNRSHIGEYVYGHLYRNYDPSYIFDLERGFENAPFFKHIYLLMLIDDSRALFRREDGKSQSTTLRMKEIELERFIEVFNKTRIRNKVLINNYNYQHPETAIQDIHVSIKKFLKYK